MYFKAREWKKLSILASSPHNITEKILSSLLEYLEFKLKFDVKYTIYLIPDSFSLYFITFYIIKWELHSFSLS